MTATTNTLLLSPEDPPPYQLHDGTDLRWLVVCDHAGHEIPQALGDLGLAAADRFDHIGWDIGACEIARHVARRLNAPFVEGVYSRLVIDCNRYPDAPDAMPETTDRRAVPGNRQLSAQARRQRISEIFEAYHGAIASRLDYALEAGVVPTLLSIHTCTSALGDAARPWEVGIGWTRDPRIAVPLLEALRSRGDIIVGDNEPYGLDLGLDFTTPEHALARGLPHVQIEFRQDLVATVPDCREWADRFVDCLLSIADRPELHRLEQYLKGDDGVKGFPAWLAGQGR
ncbi:hypothetical protein B2G71_00145 [Novosphingobium sp. PC22D]|uniref:N-formylglutamate amidohydrolase n=1 Tax=Novosphingobium sp. PC22D TaxID=1962403 RepID=UPI000BF123D8|nr:N-formylglutamate amidohydrolase [Novosphingobium sp. PC22D]PEQ14080.1 hypothetical protein B2G71_00145 [Novosphingobium sp. PC22D]